MFKPEGIEPISTYEDITGTIWKIQKDVTCVIKPDKGWVQVGETYTATAYNPKSNKVCVDLGDDWIGWYDIDLFDYEGRSTPPALPTVQLNGTVTLPFKMTEESFAEAFEKFLVQQKVQYQGSVGAK